MIPTYSKKEIEQLSETIYPILKRVFILTGINTEVKFSLPHLCRETISNDAVWNILIKNTAVRYNGGEIMKPSQNFITNSTDELYKLCMNHHPKENDIYRYNKNNNVNWNEEDTMYVIYKDGSVQNLCTNYFYNGNSAKNPPTRIDQTPIIKALKGHFIHPCTKANKFANSIKEELLQKTCQMGEIC